MLIQLYFFLPYGKPATIFSIKSNNWFWMFLSIKNINKETSKETNKRQKLFSLVLMSYFTKLTYIAPSLRFLEWILFNQTFNFNTQSLLRISISFISLNNRCVICMSLHNLKQVSCYHVRKIWIGKESCYLFITWQMLMLWTTFTKTNENTHGRVSFQPVDTHFSVVWGLLHLLHNKPVIFPVLLVPIYKRG